MWDIGVINTRVGGGGEGVRPTGRSLVNMGPSLVVVVHVDLLRPCVKREMAKRPPLTSPTNVVRPGCECLAPGPSGGPAHAWLLGFLGELGGRGCCVGGGARRNFLRCPGLFN